MAIPVAKRWSHEELEYLRRHYRRLPTTIVSKHLGRSEGSIHTVAEKIGVTQPTFKVPPREWFAEEDGLLLELYGIWRSKEIARELGRTIGSVHHRAEELGLFSRKWSPEFKRRQSRTRTGKPFTGLLEPALAGYVAGIIDGEGSILAPPRVTVSVTTTTKALALALLEGVGGNVTGPYLYAQHKRFGDRLCRLKPQYHWNFGCQFEVYRLLKRVRPHLVVKAREAESGIRYFESELKWRIE